MEIQLNPNTLSSENQDIVLSSKKWYVLRDLKRSNAKTPAYKFLQEKNIEVFTPMRWRLSNRRGKIFREEVPFIQDLLFAHETREKLDPIIESIPTLQYRFQKGKKYGDVMIVPDKDMERFIYAVSNVNKCYYYLPAELTSSMCGARIRIVGGNLDGYEGFLLSLRGSRIKRLLVELPSWLFAAVEVNPEYIIYL